jgi:16S rRNA (guanine527-N7)-methyltransferase
MDPARIAALLEPFLSAKLSPSCRSERASAREKPDVLSPAQLRGISIYIDLILRWNARINLTAIRDPEEIVTRHFGESFFVARILFPAFSANSAVKGVHVADVGSGAGFPGLPINLWAPHVSLTLIESNHKKAAFLREAARALTLTNVNVLTSRAEELLNQSSGSPASFDIVTLRAVERFEAILPIASSLLAPQGRLVLLIGSAQVKPALAALPSLSWDNPVPVPLSRSRVVAVAQR